MNSTAPRKIPMYQKHAGTVVVSGKSEVGKIAGFAAGLVLKKVPNVEFLFIGANAGQQAYKACSVLRDVLDGSHGVHVHFTPHRFLTETADRDILSQPVKNDTGEQLFHVKDASTWRVNVVADAV